MENTQLEAMEATVTVTPMADITAKAPTYRRASGCWGKIFLNMVAVSLETMMGGDDCWLGVAVVGGLVGQEHTAGDFLHGAAAEDDQTDTRANTRGLGDHELRRRAQAAIKSTHGSVL
jgi:hypothetical protein